HVGTAAPGRPGRAPARQCPFAPNKKSRPKAAPQEPCNLERPTQTQIPTKFRPADRIREGNPGEVEGDLLARYLIRLASAQLVARDDHILQYDAEYVIPIAVLLHDGDFRNVLSRRHVA